MFSSLVRGISRGSRFTKSSDPRRRFDQDAIDTRRIARETASDLHDVDDEASSENEEEDLDDEDNPDEEDPLLPIFSSAHLDSLPVYTLTHTIRLLIVKRCETTLSWEQLRTPQISQFLVKPIQNSIRASHFNRATLYVLLANCLQFKKEGQVSPGTVGICNTRALLAELLAMRMLKDYSTRELIDALSYDFDPMSGMPQPVISFQGLAPVRQIALARSSTLEVALRAEAKKFIAHPLVVQHLEAIWAGSIVFHSAADRLHRYPTKPRVNHDRHYGATHHPSYVAGNSTRPGGLQEQAPIPTHAAVTIRRSVTLYDPSNASLFKLSRLRVPRYRQIFSTVSYGVMLALFLTVLSERSLDLSAVETVFWFWSAGFMLDELVGFSEQGFGLYIASVWNVFDIGILLLLLVYYMLRLTSVLLPGPDRRVIAAMAYDVLASTAILLFPRFFNTLDHYRYFSQLLIAFRLMVQDLAAVMFLIAIACSGFFVAFTFSFGHANFDGRGVAYALFQMLMGFTPAAWDIWSQFNVLGQVLLALFLLISHFLVVTILISVLTNSFMAIVKNANEEHQFLFAVNVISMVKSDMLFSFIAPINLAGWIISPFRYCMPFHHYVLLNRSLIKATHFPILFAIFAYERLWLLRYSHEPVEHVERRGRTLHRVPTFALGQDPYGTRLRNPSAATFQDQALAEVFRRPFNDGSTMRKREPSLERRKSVVDDWMSGLSGPHTPLPGESSSMAGRTHHRSHRRGAHSHASEDIHPQSLVESRLYTCEPEDDTAMIAPNPRRNEDSDLINLDDKPADADDELDDDLLERSTTGEETEDQGLLIRRMAPNERAASSKIKFQEPLDPPSIGSTVRARILSSSPSSFIDTSPAQELRTSKPHSRQASSNTILFKPVSIDMHSSQSSHTSSGKERQRRSSRPTTAIKSLMLDPEHSSGKNAPSPRWNERTRPSMPFRSSDMNKSMPSVGGMLASPRAYTGRHRRRTPSFDTFALDLASDIGDNRHNDTFVPGSFQTHVQYGLDAMHRQRREEDRQNAESMNRIMLSRMSTIEEGFKDILKEVKELKNPHSRGGSATESGSPAKRAMRARPSKARPDAGDNVAGYRQQSPNDVAVDPLMPESATEHNDIRASTAPSFRDA